MVEGTIALIDFMSENFMTQFVNEPTRIRSPLDLVISNSSRLVYDISIEASKLSDHKLVKVMLPAGMLSGKASNDLPNYKDFKLLDLQNADFEKIRSSLATTDWKSLWESSSLNDFPNVLNNVVLNACKAACPLRKFSGSKSHSPIQGLHALQRKKRKLHCRLEALKKFNPNSTLIPKLEAKLKQHHSNIMLMVKNNSLKQEKNAIYQK